MFRILLRLAPPVMLAQLIQALYHIVDSYSDTGWLLSRFGPHAFWFTFPLTELVTTDVGMLFYRQWRRKLPACLLCLQIGSKRCIISRCVSVWYT